MRGRLATPPLAAQLGGWRSRPVGLAPGIGDDPITCAEIGEEESRAGGRVSFADTTAAGFDTNDPARIFELAENKIITVHRDKKGECNHFLDEKGVSFREREARVVSRRCTATGGMRHTFGHNTFLRGVERSLTGLPVATERNGARAASSARRSDAPRGLSRPHGSRHPPRGRHGGLEVGLRALLWRIR